MRLKRSNREKLNTMSLIIYGCKSKWRTQLRKKVFVTDSNGVRRAKYPTLKDVYKTLLIGFAIKAKQEEQKDVSKKN